MVQFTFPSAFLNQSGFPLGSPPTYHSATWLYDATASQLLGRQVWTERSYHTGLGNDYGRSEMFHCFGYGLHLVGSSGTDGNPGAIYQYAAQGWDAGTTEAGAQSQQQIVCDRICPHLFNGNKRVVYNRIEFELARGVGNQVPPGDNPQISHRWSNDGGNTWQPWQNLNMGRAGQYGLRVYQNRCGYARDRVWQVRCTDPVYNSLAGAELDLIACEG
jgi:hypothetical protein